MVDNMGRGLATFLGELHFKLPRSATGVLNMQAQQLHARLAYARPARASHVNHPILRNCDSSKFLLLSIMPKNPPA